MNDRMDPMDTETYIRITNNPTAPEHWALAFGNPRSIPFLIWMDVLIEAVQEFFLEKDIFQFVLMLTLIKEKEKEQYIKDEMREARLEEKKLQEFIQQQSKSSSVPLEQRSATELSQLLATLDAAILNLNNQAALIQQNIVPIQQQLNVINTGWLARRQNAQQTLLNVARDIVIYSADGSEMPYEDFSSALTGEPHLRPFAERAIYNPGLLDLVKAEPSIAELLPHTEDVLSQIHDLLKILRHLEPEQREEFNPAYFLQFLKRNEELNKIMAEVAREDIEAKREEIKKTLPLLSELRGHRDELSSINQTKTEKLTEREKVVAALAHTKEKGYTSPTPFSTRPKPKGL